MKFAENLRELRKQFGFSQEDLAEKLEVSRQAVSKWENNTAYPELDKLLILCDLFNCTMDDLLKGEIKEKNGVSKKIYEEHMNTFAKAITFGVMLILFGISMNGFMHQELGDLSTNYVFWICAFIAILVFVYFGMKDSDFKKHYPKAPVHLYQKEEIERFEGRFRIAMLIGIAIILLAAFSWQPLHKSLETPVSSGIFFLLLTFGVGIVMYHGMQHTKYEQTEPTFVQDKKAEETIGRFCGVVMLLATAIFLIWSFVFGAWNIAWIVFPVGGIVCGIISTLFGKDTKESNEE